MDSSLALKLEQKYDSLTGTFERNPVEKFAKELISENHPFSLLLIDGDNFKNVNDNFGHKVGDIVIKLIAEKIKSAFDGIGIVGRFGGDEFIVVLPDIVEYDEVWAACNTLSLQFREFTVPDYPSIFITITTGLSRFPQDGSDYDTLFEKADKALYRGKQKGRSCFIIYLDSKHKNIKVLSSDSPTTNSMQLISTVFMLLGKSSNLKISIPYLLTFFTTTLMIDHIAVQGKKSLLFSEVYSLSKGKEFSYIDNSLISLNINPSIGIFCLTDIHQLSFVHQKTLEYEFEKQLVISTFYAEISYAGNFYGYLRADATASRRIWQHSDMDLLLTAAKSIAMALYFQDKTLEDL